MPSKFVAKAYVQNEVTRVRGELLEKIEETKTEIIQQANELISAARDVDLFGANWRPRPTGDGPGQL